MKNNHHQGDNEMNTQAATCQHCDSAATHRFFKKAVTVKDLCGSHASDHRRQIKESLASEKVSQRRNGKRVAVYEVIAHTTLVRNALASSHKEWMAQARREGAYRGEKVFIEGFPNISWFSSKQNEEWFYEKAWRAAEQQSTEAESLVTGLDVNAIEEEIAATYANGELPEHLGGQA
jgi:hypothetical protein